MMLAMWCTKHTVGVRLQTIAGWEALRPRAAVDDVTMFGSGLPTVVAGAMGMLQHGAAINLITHADKFAILHYSPRGGVMKCVPRVHQVGGYELGPISGGTMCVSSGGGGGGST